MVADFPAPRTAFLEASFPDALKRLAQASCHLTPQMVAAEIRKMPETKTVIAVHIKPHLHDTTVRELDGLNIPNLVIGTSECDYEL